MNHKDTLHKISQVNYKKEYLQERFSLGVIFKR
jgi:hypothetical protein